jgi:hypothetical protein
VCASLQRTQLGDDSRTGIKSLVFGTGATSLWGALHTEQKTRARVKHGPSRNADGQRSLIDG